jgi:uncharacterized protein (DUF427 family)
MITAARHGTVASPFVPIFDRGLLHRVHHFSSPVLVAARTVRAVVSPRAAMSARVFETLLPQLRHEPARRRVRATLSGEVVVDSSQAILVWEPQRIIPAYAVPREHINGELLSAPAATAPAGRVGYQLPDGQTVLDPSVPFAVHTADGEPLSLRAAGQTREGVAFRSTDPDLDGLVLLDFAGFDGWYEENDPVVGHPRDLLHRIDVLPSSRAVRIELDGVLLAESARARLLFEHPALPVRAYLPPEDIGVPLQPSPTRTRCPYKGEAAYWSLDSNGRTIHDLAWSYETPRDEAAPIRGLVSFFNERVDVILDGEPHTRPRTAWS